VASDKARARSPNILLIVADDLGFSDLGCYGGEIATPTLDQLAASGLRFTQFYNTSRCWPSRASILTGYYAQQVRMDPPHPPLPSWTRVLPHYLKPLGYRCYHSGKWHLFGAPRPITDAGFDHSYRLEDQDRHFSPQVHLDDGRPLPHVDPASGFYSTEAIADHAIRCLKEHAEHHSGQPFFEYLAFTAPHFPIQAPPEDIARYRGRYAQGWDVVRQQRWARQRNLGIVNCALAARDPYHWPPWNVPEHELWLRISPFEVARAFGWVQLSAQQRAFQAAKMEVHAAMVDRMDREVARVLAQVGAMGALEDTVVLFLSDNGASAEQIIRGDGHDPRAPIGSARTFLGIGPGWSTAANAPLRLHKSWVHEGGISTPLIVNWPKGITARGELRHNPGHVIDLVPTLLDLAGGRASETWKGKPVPRLPGLSLAPAFVRDGTVNHPYLYFSHEGNRALRKGDWKIVSTRHAPDAWEFYDLKTDRCEMVNRAMQQPVHVREMAQEWKSLDAAFRAQARE
jgi:arylsulfatase